MTLDQALQRRSLIGKAGACVCILFAIAILDGVVAQMREPVNVFQVLPGAALQINGSLAEKLSGIEELTHTSTTDAIHVTFETLYSGFWLGGYMWRALLTVDAPCAPGSYTVTVGLRNNPQPKPLASFQIHVHPDANRLRQTYQSIIQRTFNLSPWWLVGALLPLIGLAFGVVYWLSQKISALLAQRGEAEIYLVREAELGQDIAFGLGTRHGIRVGSQVTVLNGSGQPVGAAIVSKVSETDALARVGLEGDVKPGYMVVKG
jgi:hypothetical protein